MTLCLLQDRNLIRSRARSARFALARINAPLAPSTYSRPGADIALVLDRSGSMSGEKFRLAKQAVEQGIQRLNHKDTFSVVVYDEKVTVVSESQSATVQAKRNALSELAMVSPRGTTNLGEGWLTGCGEVARHLSNERIGRVYLLTDGLANVGITDPGALATHARELRMRGVSTSTFGVGEDYDEVLLGQMADAGGGAFTHIRHPKEIPALIDHELGETLEIVARNVTLTISKQTSVQVTPVGPYPFEETDYETIIRIPDLVSAQEFELPLRITLPKGIDGDEIFQEVFVSDKDDVLKGKPLPLGWTWASHEDNDNQPRERDVDYVIAERYAAMAREEASTMNRDGQYGLAAKRLKQVAKRIAGYAGNDRKLNRIVRGLRRDAETYSHFMSSLDRKASYSSSLYIARGGTKHSLRKKWSVSPTPKD